MDPEIKIKMTREGVDQAANDLKKLEQATLAAAKAVEKLTAAEKQQAKSAQESAAFFKEKIKVVNDAMDNEGALRAMTREAKEVGNLDAATDKLGKTKSKLLDGVKKLGHEIPVLGSALGALKNPYTLIAAAAGLAIDAVRRLTEDVNKFADAASQYENVGSAARSMAMAFQEAAGKSAAFELTLARIERGAESATEKLSRMQAAVSRQFGIEDEKAGPNETPQQKEQRRQRRIAAEINVVGNAKIATGNEIRDARSALPGARTAAQAAESRLGTFENLSQQNEQFIGALGGREKMVEEIATLQNLADQGNQSAKVQLAIRQSSLSRYDAVKKATGTRIQPLRNAATAANAEVSRLESVISSGASSMRNLEIQGNEKWADLQARQGAFGFATGAPQMDPRAQEAYERGIRELVGKIERMFSESQQRIDNLSRMAAQQSQTTQ